MFKYLKYSGLAILLALTTTTVLAEFTEEDVKNSFYPYENSTPEFPGYTPGMVINQGNVDHAPLMTIDRLTAPISWVMRLRDCTGGCATKHAACARLGRRRHRPAGPTVRCSREPRKLAFWTG